MSSMACIKMNQSLPSQSPLDITPEGKTIAGSFFHEHTKPLAG